MPDLLELFPMVHGHCIQWIPDVLYPMVAGGVLTFVSYFIIGNLLALAAWKLRKQLPLVLVLNALLFGAFILFCGVGHAVNVSNIWNGQYRLEAWIDLATGIVSFTEACVLTFYYKQILSLVRFAFGAIKIAL